MAEVTLVVDGVEQIVEDQIDVSTAQDLEISGDVIASGEQSDDDLILTLASGEKLTLNNFFGTFKQINIPVTGNKTYTLKSINDPIFDTAGFVEFGQVDIGRPELGGTDSLAREIDTFSSSTPEFFRVELPGQSQANEIAPGPQQRIDGLDSDRGRFGQSDDFLGEPPPPLRGPDDFSSGNDDRPDLPPPDLPPPDLPPPDLPSSDINDTAPVLTSSGSVSAAESATDTTVLHTVTFDDEDTVNGTTVFTLSNYGADLFEINDSGEITLNAGKSLDYESGITSYGFNIVISDGVNSSQTQAVTLTVTDINDTAPVITLFDSISAPESATDTTILHTFTFDDEDTVNGTTAFTLRACEFFTNSAYSDKIYPCNREELIQPTVQF